MIYLDNSATTPMEEYCLDVYKEYAVCNFYNPSALYKKALIVGNALKDAKNILAKSLGVSKEEIIITASGSEADNLATLCSIKSKHGKVIIGSVEHSAIYNCANELKNKGYDILYAPCDKYGRTDINALSNILDDTVVLVSIMHVCNETGALNDIKSIAKLVKQKAPNALFHSDGVQAYGKIPIILKNTGIDMYSISGHKIGAPKGIGFLYCKKGINLRPIIFGGGQEGGVRSATENVAGIISLATVVERKYPQISKNLKYLKELQAYAAAKLVENIPDILINTDLNNSCPTVLSFALKNMRGEVIVHCLEDRDIIIGTGSACSARKSTHRIPKALNIPEEYIEGMLRISFNINNTKEEIDVLVSNLVEVVSELKEYIRK